MSSTEDEDDLFGDNDLDESDAEEGQADGLARDENEGDGGEETTLGPIPSLKPPALVHGDGEEEDIRMKDEEDGERSAILKFKFFIYAKQASS